MYIIHISNFEILAISNIRLFIGFPPRSRIVRLGHFEVWYKSEEIEIQARKEVAGVFHERR